MNQLKQPVIEPGQAASAGVVDISTPGPSGLGFRSPRRVLEAADLIELKNRHNVLLVDVRSPEQCVDGHIPGAVMLEYAALVDQRGAATGLLPGEARLSRVLSGIGLRADRHVVAYNDDNGTHAARLLWTLDLVGHRSFSLLNGGFAAWDELDLPVDPRPAPPSPSAYRAVIRADAWADRRYVLANLNNPDVVLLDTRTAEEYSGAHVRAARGGHIPGAVHFDWSLAVDLTDNGRLRRDDDLFELLQRAGVTPDKEIIPYCQTHHRSAHTAFVLRHLGYPRVRAYPGSWSEWGNREDLPIQAGPAATTIGRRRGVR